MIPKILLQTSKYPYPKHVQDMWKERIDESWTVEWFDDAMIHKFFKDYPLPEFPNISERFDSFPYGPHKADLFRYYYLYLNGGFFMDSDVMPNIHMNEVYSSTHDHILVTSDLEVNRLHHPEIDSPLVFNGMMGCIPRSKIVYDALKNAYTVKLRLLEKQKLYFVYDLYTISQKYKQQYNVLFLNEVTDNNSDHYSYIVDNNNRKLSTHFYGYNKIIPNMVELSINGQLVVEPIKNKTITCFTTFHKPGFDLYGKHWLSTFLDNIRRSNSHIFGRIYAEGVEPPSKFDKIEFLDFDHTIPSHAPWERTVRSNASEIFLRSDSNTTRETIRFSHKAFVIQHALKTITTDYAIWVDADCVFHKESYEGFPQNIMGNNFLACQLEENIENDSGNHIESGLLVFDMHHPDTARFVQEFSNNYKVERLKKYVRPFDGYIINRTLEELKLPYTNLNKEYGVVGIQGDTANTFLHPEISKRFKHNIGAYGKSDYKDWDNVKHLDENFQHLTEHIQKHPR